MAIYTHVCLGTNDLEQATKFYDAVLGALNVSNMGPMGENGVMYGTEAPELVITKPRNGEAACFANGGTVGFEASSREAVQKFHEAGLANGGSDEGEPGPREFSPTAYGAYLRDPCGNKICAYSFVPE